MSLKRRLTAIEKNAGTGEAKVVWSNTYIEGWEGEIERDVSFASLIWGYRMCGNAQIGSKEPRHQYEARVNGYAKLTWEEAQSADGLIIPEGQLRPNEILA